MDLGRWDTVCTIDVTYANGQLASNPGELLQTFSYSGSDPLSGADYTISGVFGAWQIVPGGSDTLIHMAVPLASGSFVTAAGATDLAGMTVVVQISLNLLPAAAGGTALLFNFQSVGAATNAAAGAVVPLTTSDPRGTGRGSYVGLAVAQSLVANAAAISFAFSSIGIAGESPPWLAPVSSAYRYQQAVGTDDGYLAILSTTSPKDVSSFDTEIDPALMSDAYTMALGISGALFLQNVVAPALTGAFPGTSGSTYTYDAASGAILNTAPISLPAVTWAVISYTPIINTLSVTIESSFVRVSAAGTCSLHLPNAYIAFTVTANNAVAFDESTHSLSFVPDPSPVTTSEKEIPFYDYVLLGIVSPIAALILALVTSTVADDLSASLSGVAGLGGVPPMPVQWHGMSAWTMENAQLGGGLLLQGAPVASQL